MEPLRVYADATALIGLGRIGRLDLLDLLPPPILVTAQIWEEAAGDPRRRGAAALIDARERGLLLVVDEGDPDAFPQLDPGESTVLSAAAAAGAIALLDERKARSVVNSDPSLRATIRQVTGIVGLILLAKRRGRIGAVRPILDDLMRQSFRIGPSFYDEILRQAGES
ncbi:MAG TPA: DUF3368 domain-containing protein [Dehalococcoidia bacterium]|nr:DUF3368 domain-containing protein [Dehalococcoidia bacterium]